MPDWSAIAAFLAVIVAWIAIQRSALAQMRLSWIQVQRDYMDLVLRASHDTIKASQKFAADWQIFRASDPLAPDPVDHRDERRRLHIEYYAAFREFERNVDAARVFFKPMEPELFNALDTLHSTSISLFRHMALTTRRRDFVAERFEEHSIFIAAKAAADNCAELIVSRLADLYARAGRLFR